MSENVTNMQTDNIHHPPAYHSSSKLPTGKNKAKKPLQKRQKIIIAIGLAVLLVFLGFKLPAAIKRSNNIAKYRDAEYLEQDVQNYLKNRYGEDFVIETMRGRSYAYDYINMYAYPADVYTIPLKPEAERYKFKIQGRFDEEGELEYCDSYIMVKLTDDYEAYIDPIIGKYYDNYFFHVKFNSEWLTSNIPPDTTLEELWNYKANVDYALPEILLSIGPGHDRSVEHLEEMVKELSMHHIRAGGTVAYYSNEVCWSTHLTGDWNSDVDHLVDMLKDIESFLIYDENKYEITTGGRSHD